MLHFHFCYSKVGLALDIGGDKKWMCFQYKLLFIIQEADCWGNLCSGRGLSWIGGFSLFFFLLILIWKALRHGQPATRWLCNYVGLTLKFNCLRRAPAVFLLLCFENKSDKDSRHLQVFSVDGVKHLSHNSCIVLYRKLYKIRDLHFQSSVKVWNKWLFLGGYFVAIFKFWTIEKLEEMETQLLTSNLSLLHILNPLVSTSGLVL